MSVCTFFGALVMLKNRLIAVIIVRDGQVVQSIRFKHTNVIHSDARHAVEVFSNWSIDEIVMLNVSRDINSKQQFLEVVDAASKYCFVPLSIGGWIQEEDYAKRLLRSGADKLVLNTAFIDFPDLVRKLSRLYGKQCIVASMDVKRSDENHICVFVDRGRRNTGISPVEHAESAVDLGAGEIFFNSIDHDGARKGYDIETLKSIISAVDVPVIAFGGVLDWGHFIEGAKVGAAAVAAANIFHYKEQSTIFAKTAMKNAGISVRSAGTHSELLNQKEEAI